MRKDITKKFLENKNKYLEKMISLDVGDISIFAFKNDLNTIASKQIRYDEIEFKNVFSTTFTKTSTKKFLENGDKIKKVISKNGKRIGFNMIYCESAIFTMGSNNSKDNNPSRVVEIERPFLLGETEVTQELYELVMGYNPSAFPGKKDLKQRPVEKVTWYDAIMFCNKLSALNGKSLYYEITIDSYVDKTQTNILKANVEINEGANGFRLPLSKEWEYAAKTKTNNQWSGTNDVSKIGLYAWFDDNSKEKTHPASKKKKNEWNFYDMSGNVFEWCWDLDKSKLDLGYRIFRGGGWDSNTLYLKSTRLGSSAPGYRNDNLGFRVSATL